MFSVSNQSLSEELAQRNKFDFGRGHVGRLRTAATTRKMPTAIRVMVDPDGRFR